VWWWPRGKWPPGNWQQESSHVTSADLLLAQSGPANLISFLLFSFSTRRVVLGRLGNLNLTRAGNSKFLPKKTKQETKQETTKGAEMNKYLHTPEMKSCWSPLSPTHVPAKK
jgi:hypothetical protein